MVLFLYNVYFYLDFEWSNPVCHVNSALWMLQWLKGILQFPRNWSSNIFSVIATYRHLSSRSFWLKKGGGGKGRTCHDKWNKWLHLQMKQIDCLWFYLEEKWKYAVIFIYDIQSECSVQVQNLIEVLLPFLVLLSLPPGYTRTQVVCPGDLMVSHWYRSPCPGSVWLSGMLLQSRWDYPALWEAIDKKKKKKKVVFETVAKEIKFKLNDQNYATKKLFDRWVLISYASFHELQIQGSVFVLYGYRCWV